MLLLFASAIIVPASNPNSDANDSLFLVIPVILHDFGGKHMRHDSPEIIRRNISGSVQCINSIRNIKTHYCREMTPKEPYVKTLVNTPVLKITRDFFNEIANIP